MSAIPLAAAPSIAQEINTAHELARTAQKRSLEAARQCGELLTTAKREIGHGRWRSWLREHCPQISERTASRYMRVAARWPDLERHAREYESATVADMTLTWACDHLCEVKISEPELPKSDGEARACAATEAGVNVTRSAGGGERSEPATNTPSRDKRLMFRVEHRVLPLYVPDPTARMGYRLTQPVERPGDREIAEAAGQKLSAFSARWPSVRSIASWPSASRTVSSVSTSVGSPKCCATCTADAAALNAGSPAIAAIAQVRRVFAAKGAQPRRRGAGGAGLRARASDRLARAARVTTAEVARPRNRGKSAGPDCAAGREKG